MNEVEKSLIDLFATCNINALDEDGHFKPTLMLIEELSHIPDSEGKRNLVQTLFGE